MYIEIYTVNGESIRLEDDAKINGLSIQHITTEEMKQLFEEKCIELTKYDLTYFVNTALIAYFQMGHAIH
ncbi:lmo0673 family protein [Listeria sp. PSOL-1]|uniref:lmo0673 family protein n=1 Tax=Listeria sp. PSOL-1 TaxID=1844999 RepID=UPI0013D06FEC|nr:hypothetical protein [Listeria sp. PSOL-1]